MAHRARVLLCTPKAVKIANCLGAVTSLQVINILKNLLDIGWPIS